MIQPLKGLKILDCSVAFPGARAAFLLSRLGAHVTRIVHPHRPERTEELSPAAHANLNSSKDRVAIDLGDPNSRNSFEELVRASDGLIEGFRPETRVRLGLEPASLLLIQPKLCVVSVVGFATQSPLAGKAGHDINFAARTGLIALFGRMPPMPLGAIFCADQAALTMTAMLIEARRLGQGSHSQVSIEDSLLLAQSSQIAEFLTSGVIPKLGDSLYSGAHPAHRIYSTRDGQRIAVGAIEDRYWAQFCALIERPHLVGRQNDPNPELIAAEVSTALASRDWNDWKPVFQAADCCVDPVLDYSELENRGRLS